MNVSYGNFSGYFEYTFRENNAYTSAQVSGYTSTVNGNSTTYAYTYDGNGNITKVVYNGSTQIRYYYDNLGQLVREDNGQLNKTFVYTYDNAGNITSKSTYSLTAQNVTPTNLISTNNYGYSTGAWGDLLTEYNGVEIEYDAIGNPLDYYNGKHYEFQWTGRQLTGATKHYTDVYSRSFSYDYNDEGLRIRKTEGSTVTNYYYSGSQLIAEETNGNIRVYVYDAAGTPIGMQVYNATGLYAGSWLIFWYEKNLQGDVVAVYGDDGTKYVSYTYDAWGNFTTQYYIDGYSDLGVYDNPFLYRGYYYDYDLGLYYLQSRYYDSVTCRFISADGYVSTGQDITGYNMFAYCGNNPVNRKDSTGQFWITALIVTAVVVVCTVTLSGCSAQPTKPSNYVQENSTNQNCYSYAFDLPHSANPGDYSVSTNSDYMFKDKNIYTPEEITGFIQRDMEALNKSVRVVDSPKDKLDNEYIVAMKTSTIVIPSIGVADYHFAVQLSDGSWADKPGQKPSRWNALDGAAIAWDLGNIKNYYNTETVYFAVER